jgi:starch-binding outer membrane protein, SusD/RagB family
MQKIFRFIIVTTVVLLSGCLELDIKNPNAPDNETILSDEGNLTSITGSIATGIYRGYFTLDDNTSPFSIDIALDAVADHLTLTNNFTSWWAVFKQEPRQAVNNSITWNDKAQLNEPWNAWNGVIVNANTVIKTLEAFPELDDNLKGLLATVYFSRAMALGYISAVFDKGFIVPIDAAEYSPALVPYGDVLQESLSNFDKSISLFSEIPDFALPPEILNGLGYTSDEMIALSKTYYVHFMVSSARNAAQNASTDWAKVKEYASEGITADYILNADGSNIAGIYQGYSGIANYHRIDHRVMRHFNTELPKRFPNQQVAPVSPYTADFLRGAGYNGDKRLDAYFSFEASLSPFNPARNNGTLRSHYRIKRYDVLFGNNFVGPTVFMYSYANELYLAEAEAELDNLDAAIAILNDPDNPRKKVGEMPDLPGTLTKQEILDLIFAERDIELAKTEMGISLFNMRRRNALQIGAPLHMPVPADELTTQGLPVYTFGGVDRADGINTADGSNSWLNN